MTQTNSKCCTWKTTNYIHLSTKILLQHSNQFRSNDIHFFTVTINGHKAVWQVRVETNCLVCRQSPWSGGPNQSKYWWSMQWDKMTNGIRTLWVRSLTVTAVLLWVALYSSSASARAVLWTQLAVYKMLASFKTLSTPHSNIVHGETWGSRTKTKKGAIIVICGLYNSQDSYTSFLGTVPSKWNIAGISVVLTEVFNGFPHFLQANARTVPWLGHTYFYPIGVEQLGC